MLEAIERMLARREPSTPLFRGFSTLFPSSLEAGAVDADEGGVDRKMTRDVMVLCYHAVSPRWEAALSMSPASFDAQIRYLVGRGWRPTTFSDAVVSTSPGKVLAITFDDAFASVKDLAWPILGKYDAVATVFAPTAFMDGHTMLDWAGIDHWKHTADADELRPMNWDDLAELAAAGWEIGSHTCTHPHLTQLDDEALAHELRDSRMVCAEHLGLPCQSIAYPYGDMNPRVVAAAAAAGYETGARLSRDLRPAGPLSYPRVGLYRGDDRSRFRVKTAGTIRRLRAANFR
jgi:peptidoglycan/xylan/chitin deacetylase (PgdA/CDA1 family)